MVEEINVSFGRLYSRDERDDAFPMSSSIPSSSAKTWRYWWPSGWWGDQGTNPWCVAYAWDHWLEDGPVTHKPKSPGAGPVIDPGWLYARAQERDEWPGTNYAGTSVRAGAKVLQWQGYIESYLWATSIEDVIVAILEKGPVVVGTYWYQGMLEPDADGFVHPTGSKVGGHAYKLDGVNTEKGFFRLKNSWGRWWGYDGFARVTIDDMASLLADRGEACLAVEVEL